MKISDELDVIRGRLVDLITEVDKVAKRSEANDDTGGSVEKEIDNKKWRADPSGHYYTVVNVDGKISYTRAEEEGLASDDNAHDSHNYFTSEWEAKKVAQHINDYFVLRKDMKGFDPLEFEPRFVVRGRFDKNGEAILYVVNDDYDYSSAISFETEGDAHDSLWRHRDVWKRYLRLE